MIHPSYTELIEAINTNSEDDDTTMSLNSRYSLVLAASKRARQIIAGSKPMVEGAAGKKPLSVAIDELYKGKVKILAPLNFTVKRGKLLISACRWNPRRNWSSGF